jgi:hypothetical protein
MKRITILFSTVLTVFSLLAQPHKGIHIIRYNDNFSHIKSDSAKSGFDKLKNIPLSKNTLLSIGGELREQYQYFDNQNFGDVPPTFKAVSTGQVWHRAMLHVNVDFGKKARVFVQLNNTNRFFNPNPLTPEIDENQLSLHQAFVDVRFNPHWQLRVGRQEMSYGNNRILTFREGPNTRMSFDGGVLKYQKGKWQVDALGVSHVFGNPKIGDDETFKDFIGGVYATQTVIPKRFLMDYYVLNFTSDRRQYNYVGGHENRQSFGFRAFSRQPVFNYELEATYQTGKFNALKINAFAIAVDVNYRLVEKSKLTIGIAGNYITGDQNSRDGRLNTYNLIYSKPSFGLAAPIGASNITNVNPYVRISPLPKLNLSGGVYFLARQSVADGIYSPGMAQVRRNGETLSNNSAKKIGQQYAFEAAYQHNAHWAFYVDGAYFVAGDYVKMTGKGLPIGYYSAKASFKF